MVYVFSVWGREERVERGRRGGGEGKVWRLRFGGVVSRLCPVCLFRFVRGDEGAGGRGGEGVHYLQLHQGA